MEQPTPVVAAKILMYPSRFLFTLCIALALGCSACGGYSSNSSSNCFFNALNISPSSATADHNLLAPGNSQQFMAFGQASSSSCTYTQANLTNVSWSVSDTTNANIGNTMTGNPQTDNYGLATCLHSSNAPITVTAMLPSAANSGHTASGTATLTCK
jgi:hypothetical protein